MAELDADSRAKLAVSEMELASAVDLRNRTCRLQDAAQEQLLLLESK